MVAVDAPFSRSPYIGQTIARGVELAASEINVAGLAANNDTYSLKVKRYDNALSPRKALSNVRRAIADGAVAIIDDGTGVDASWKIARDNNVPICITYDGGSGLVDLEKRPNVFRIAPTNRGISFRLAEYTIPKGLKLALMHDDTTYGQQGADALDKAFEQNPESVAAKLTLPARDTDLSPQVLRARRAGATGLIVWGQASTIAEVLIAARSAGWDVPVYAPPSAEDPVLRQAARGPAALARRPDLRFGAHDRRARPRLLLRVRVQVRRRVRRAESGRAHERGSRGDRSARLRDVLVRLHQRARAGASATSASTTCRTPSNRSRLVGRTGTSADSTSTTTKASSTTTCSSHASTT